MSLQDTFYVLAIIYMSISLVILLAVVVAVFVIKAKINNIQRQVEEKLHAIATFAAVAETFIAKFQHRK